MLFDHALRGVAAFDREVETRAAQGWFRECVAVAMESTSWADVVAMDPVTRGAFLAARKRLMKEAHDAPPDAD